MLLRNFGAIHDETRQNPEDKNINNKQMKRILKLVSKRLWTELRAFVVVVMIILVPESCSVEIVNNFGYKYDTIIVLINTIIF